MSGRPRALEWAVRLATLAVVAAVALWGGAQVDFHEVGHVLRRADPLLLATAMSALLLAHTLLRAARFHALVASLPAPSRGGFRYLESARTLVASQAANNLVPLRLGELVRTRDLVAHGYALGQVAVVQLLEKAVEVGSLFLCALPLIPLGVLRLPSFSPAALAGMAGAAAALGVGLWIWARRAQVPWRSLWTTNRGALGRSTLWALAADAAELVLIAVCLRSVGIAPDLLRLLAVLVGINLAITPPSTPAQFGAYEAGAAIALTIFGVPAEEAVAFALLYHVVHWVPITLAGGVLWLRGQRTAAAGEASTTSSRSA